MSRLIPAAERIVRARKLIQQAREYPVPADSEGGRNNFSYIAQVKDYLRQARDMVKFISMTPSATNAMKEEVRKIYEEIEKAGQEIL
jgi:2-methylisocitrate lyase-like PEP mutase family enzyme